MINTLAYIRMSPLQTTIFMVQFLILNVAANKLERSSLSSFFFLFLSRLQPDPGDDPPLDRPTPPPVLRLPRHVRHLHPGPDPIKRVSLAAKS